MTQKSARRRPSRRSLIVRALLVAGLLLGGYGVMTAKLIRADMLRARAYAQAARRAVTGGDVEGARIDAGLASRAVAHARSRSLDPFLSAVRPLPFLGRQVAVLRALTDAGVESTTALDEMVDVVERSPDLLQGDLLAHGGGDLTPIVARLRPSVPDLLKASGHIGNARNLVKATPARGVLPQLGAARTDFLRELDAADRDVNTALGLVSLGERATRKAPLRLLLLSQDTWELRPSGGYIGSYGIIELRRGRLHLVDYADAVALPVPKPDARIRPPDPLGSALTHPWTLTGAGWWPDFPTSARAAQRLFLAQGGTKVDGVVAVTQTFLEDLLRGLGSVRVSGYPEAITAGNVAERILYHVELKRPLEIPRKRFLTRLTRVLFDGLEHFKPAQARHVIDALGRAFHARHAQIFFNDPKLNRPFALAGWDGAMLAPSNGSDYLSVADADFGTDKATRWVRKRISYRVYWNARQQPEAEVRVDTTDFGPPSEINPGYTSYLRAYTLPGARFTPTSRAGEFTRRGREGPFQTLGLDQVIAPGHTETRTFVYTLPMSVVRDGRYALVVRPQAGTPNDRYEIRIELGARPVTLSFAGDAGDHLVQSEAIPPSKRGPWVVRFWRSWKGALRR